MPKRAVLVTGDRYWQGVEVIEKVLATFPKNTVVVHGNAGGADSCAEIAALHLGMPRCINPYYGGFGRAGGPMRNSVMLALVLGLQLQGWQVEVIAFHDNITESKGTANMLMQAKRSGLKRRLFKHASK